MTRTFATLSVTAETYAEIRALLDSAGYAHTFIKNQDGEIIDLSGLALKGDPPKPPTDPASLVDQLGALLAEVTDATLLTVKDVGNSCDVDLTLGSFRSDLGERCAALLEEAGL